jgi:hypothetical protein
VRADLWCCGSGDGSVPAVSELGTRESVLVGMDGFGGRRSGCRKGRAGCEAVKEMDVFDLGLCRQGKRVSWKCREGRRREGELETDVAELVQASFVLQGRLKRSRERTAKSALLEPERLKAKMKARHP